MEERQHCAQHALCSTCRRERKANLTVRGVLPPGRILLLALSLSFCLAEGTPTETLCGAELVDTLQFVCGERGFHISRPNRQRGRHQGGIVEQCCFSSCSLELLEQYCATPSVSGRDLSRHILPALHTETVQRPHPVRFSLWQKQSVQRLRRGLPTRFRTLQHPQPMPGDGARDAALRLALGRRPSPVPGASASQPDVSRRQPLASALLLDRRPLRARGTREEAAVKSLFSKRPLHARGASAKKDARVRQPLAPWLSALPLHTHTARK